MRNLLTDEIDYEAILHQNNVTVEINDYPPFGYSFTWEPGTTYVGKAKYPDVLKAIAIFVILWKLGFNATLCNRLMQGYLLFDLTS
jgi:hypothetical protein